MSVLSLLPRIPAMLLALSLCLQAGASRLCAEGRPLTENPGFFTDKNRDEWPDGWPKGKGLSWHVQPMPELSFLRLKTEEPGQSVSLYKAIQLPAGVRSIDYLIQARAFDVVAGAESWHDARLVMEFRDAGNAKLRPVPAPLIVSRSGSRPDWKSFSGTLEVPPEATSLVLIGALFYCQSGTLDIGFLELKAQE